MEKKKIKSPFVLRSYTKMELVHLYLPHYSQRVALRRFNRWIRASPMLWDKLQDNGVTIYTKVYSPTQVQLITGYLGVP